MIGSLPKKIKDINILEVYHEDIQTKDLDILKSRKRRNNPNSNLLIKRKKPIRLEIKYERV